MKRLVVLMIAMTMTYLLPGFASAAGVTMVRGGGTGTFGADLDGDGDVDASSFGMGVRILTNGTASGHFLCLMAGRSDILGLPLMSVQGSVTHGSLNAALVGAGVAVHALVPERSSLEDVFLSLVEGADVPR